MKYSFKIRDRDVSVVCLDFAVAVRPEQSLVQRGLSRTKLAMHFGKLAVDDSRERVGTAIAAATRKKFERAGWCFCEPTKAVRNAARRRIRLDNAQAAREVFLDENGNTIIGTHLATVQLSPDFSADAAVAELKKDRLRPIRTLAISPNTFVVRLPAHRKALEMIAELQPNTERYVFVEPVMIESWGHRAVPNDPEFRRQWHLQKLGTLQVWERTRGAGVRIAIIDTGFHTRHRDLKAGVVGGGYFLEDRLGESDFVPFDPSDSDFPRDRHGTFCAGMAAARSNNRLAGCGVAPEAGLILIACLKDQVGSQETLAEAMMYAADPSTVDSEADSSDGADVISCSLGPTNGVDFSMTSVLKKAIDFATRVGRRQHGNDLGTPIFWPVSNVPGDLSRDEVCSDPNTIAVGSSDRSDDAAGSAEGPQLDFLAPGESVLSTTPGNSLFGWKSGTSYAAPCAAATAALVLAENPGLSWRQVRERLRSTCDKPGDPLSYSDNGTGRNDVYGFGRINADRAVAVG